jgi:hypothetical protein
MITLSDLANFCCGVAVFAFWWILIRPLPTHITMENTMDKDIETLLAKKDDGKLLIHMYMPDRDIFPPSVRALWCGRGQTDPFTETERNGFVQPLHASFGK